MLGLFFALFFFSFAEANVDFNPVYSEKAVVYLTDAEGDWEYFKNSLLLSDYFSLDKNGKLKRSKDCVLVYGGDVVDREGGVLKILKFLLSQKKQYPDTVLIAGNRDVNKILLSFLDDDEIFTGATPFLREPEELQASFVGWLRTYIQDDPTISFEAAFSDYSYRLKWFLQVYLAAGSAFDFLKSELIQLSSLDFSDRLVAEHWRSLVSPHEDGNYLFQYLQQAQLIAKVGRVAIVHGALKDESYMRDLYGQTKPQGFESWVESINKQYQAVLRSYVLDPSYSNYKTLLEYQMSHPMTPGKNDQSLVYGRYSGSDGQNILPANYIQDALYSQGLSLVLAGHTPQGNFASFMLGKKDLAFLIADVSSSADTKSHVVVVEGSQIKAKAFHAGYGLLQMTYDLSAVENEAFGQNVDGFVVKAKLANGDYLLEKISKPDGRYVVQAKIMGAQELCEAELNKSR